MVTTRSSGDALVFADTGTAASTKHELEPDVACVRLKPVEMRFVTGVARAYDDAFPLELSHLVRSYTGSGLS